MLWLRLSFSWRRISAEKLNRSNDPYDYEVTMSGNKCSPTTLRCQKAENKIVSKSIMDWINDRTLLGKAKVPRAERKPYKFRFINLNSHKIAGPH